MAVQGSGGADPWVEGKCKYTLSAGMTSKGIHGHQKFILAHFCWTCSATVSLALKGTWHCTGLTKRYTQLCYCSYPDMRLQPGRQRSYTVVKGTHLLRNPSIRHEVSVRPRSGLGPRNTPVLPTYCTLHALHMPPYSFLRRKEEPARPDPTMESSIQFRAPDFAPPHHLGHAQSTPTYSPYPCPAECTVPGTMLLLVPNQCQPTTWATYAS